MSSTDTGNALLIRRTFKAPRSRVFDAWTKPEILREWFGPTGMTTPEATMDLREGGRYRIVILDEDGDRHVAVGEFTRIRPPEHLAMTWSWEETSMPEGEMPSRPTHITIDFLDRGTETEMVFKHEGFVSEESRDSHNRGWTGSFDKLTQFLNAIPR